MERDVVTIRVGSVLAQHVVKVIATVFLAGAVIWLIVLRKPTDYLSDERWVQGFTNEMIGDLKGLAGGERHFFETHETYSTELRALDSARWFFSPNAHLDVSADARTWSATAHHQFITTTCAMSALRSVDGSETVQGPNCSSNAAFTSAWDSARGARRGARDTR